MGLAGEDNFMEKKSSGYIILYSIVVLGSIALALVIYLSSFVVSDSRTNTDYQKSLQARSLADSCVELGLMAIRNNTNFSGTNNFTLEQGNCTYTVINSGGSIREVRSTGSVGAIIRKVKVITSQLNPQIQLSSWTEVADF